MSDTLSKNLVLPNTTPFRVVSEENLHQYQEQRDLEVTFLCKDGQQMCDRQTLGLSDFLYKKAKKMGGLDDKIEFKYTDYRREAVKYFLDCMHMIKPDPTDITIILEVLDLAHSEGKTTYDSFERYLSGRLMKLLLETSYPTGTELLIAAFLSKVDHLHEEYQRKLARHLTREFYIHLFCDFDMASSVNKQLIEMCIGRGILNDSTHKSVVYTMAMFGQDVERIYGVPSTFEHEKLLDMEQNIFALPRRTFCWLDEKNVIVISKNSRATIGHCELVNTDSKEHQTIKIEHGFVVSAVKVSSGKFVTGNNNGSVSLFDGSKLIQTKRLGLNAVQVEYLNGQIVAAIKDGNLLILNRSLGIIKEFMDTNYKVGAICGNSNYLAVCDYSGFVWYYQRGYSEQTYKHHNRVNSVQMKDDLLVSASSDNTVQVWNMERHERLWELNHGDKVWSTILRDDQVITCCNDKSVRVLALESGEELHRLDHPDPCDNADLSPNKSLLAVACRSAVVLWDIRKAIKIEQFNLGSVSLICELRFNPSGDKIIVGLHNGQVFKIEMN